MTNRIKALARQSKTAIILFKIFDNWRMKRRINAGKIETVHGSTHLGHCLAESLIYIDKQFEDYLRYAGLTVDAVYDKKILELGPGDNLGVALKFLTAGAQSVVCLDRFYSQRDSEREKEIYAAMRSNLSTQMRLRFDEAISLTDAQPNPRRLDIVYGNTLERLADSLTSRYGSFDFIVSCAVLEEIYDLDATFAAMDKLISGGGYLIHRIDLSDYGIFRNQGMHPLTFLTIPERIYKRMAADSGLPNRKRISYYVDRMKELGYDARFFITSTVSRGRLEPAVEYMNGALVDNTEDLESFRPQLADAFRNEGNHELEIDGILMVARKRS
jgi:hypothetical protein